MNSLHPDFRDFLACLNSTNVRYLLVGGYAVNFYGHHRNTKDIDVWIAVDVENATRIANALIMFGFSNEEVSPDLFLRRHSVLALGRAPVRIDILSDVDGLEFEACYSRKLEAELDGVQVRLLRLDDLLTNKVASGRLQDQADAKVLSEIQAKNTEAPNLPSADTKRKSPKKS